MSAVTENRQQVYVSDQFSEPMSAQHNFANNFDLNAPEEAMSAYQRYVLRSDYHTSYSNDGLESCTSTPSVSLPLPPTLPADEAAPRRPTSLSARLTHSTALSQHAPFIIHCRNQRLQCHYQLATSPDQF